MDREGFRRLSLHASFRWGAIALGAGVSLAISLGLDVSVTGNAAAQGPLGPIRRHLGHDEGNALLWQLGLAPALLALAVAAGEHGWRRWAKGETHALALYTSACLLLLSSCGFLSCLAPFVVWLF